MERRVGKKNSAGVGKVHFAVVSKLGAEIRTTEQYWKVITRVKHPVMRGKEKEVQKTLQKPDSIRRSKADKNVYLFYRKHQKHYLVVVVRHLSAKQGFIITTYITDTIKEGTQVWPKRIKITK